jgi:glutathione peroxidase
VTFIIDKQGVVRRTFNSQFQATKHVSEAIDAAARDEVAGATIAPVGSRCHETPHADPPRFLGQDDRRQEQSLRDYAGKVALVVNVASQCGLTPQYGGLEELYENFKDRGLVVLGFRATSSAARSRAPKARSRPSARPSSASPFRCSASRRQRAERHRSMLPDERADDARTVPGTSVELRQVPGRP